jgi:hypothetical protein
MHCEKMAVTDMAFLQSAVIEFLVKEGNSAGITYERLHGEAYRGVSSVRRCVKQIRTEKWTLPISRAVVDFLEKRGND